jgi:hypothetical protein
MASYSVNESGIAHARRLIATRQYVLRSQWGEVQPAADAENQLPYASQSWLSR